MVMNIPKTGVELSWLMATGVVDWRGRLEFEFGHVMVIFKKILQGGFTEAWVCGSVLVCRLRPGDATVQ